MERKAKQARIAKTAKVLESLADKKRLDKECNIVATLQIAQCDVEAVATECRNVWARSPFEAWNRYLISACKDDLPIRRLFAHLIQVPYYDDEKKEFLPLADDQVKEATEKCSNILQVWAYVAARNQTLLSRRCIPQWNKKSMITNHETAIRYLRYCGTVEALKSSGIKIDVKSKTSMCSARMMTYYGGNIGNDGQYVNEGNHKLLTTESESKTVVITGTITSFLEDLK